METRYKQQNRFTQRCHASSHVSPSHSPYIITDHRAVIHQAITKIAQHLIVCLHSITYNLINTHVCTNVIRFGCVVAHLFMSERHWIRTKVIA